MDTDREGLLPDRFRLSNSSPTTTTSKFKKNLLFILTISSIILCLFFYLYLNMEAINENQMPDSNHRYKPLSRRKPMLDDESIFSESGPSMIKLTDLLAHCIVALRIAGKEVVNLSLANNHKLNNVGSKGRTLEGVDDVITNADMKSHHMILNTIKDSYRRLTVVSEEDTTSGFEGTSFQDDLLPIDRVEFARLLRNDLQEIEHEHAARGSLITQHETLVWIDPLDATKEYSENLTNYVTLMACIVHKSEPIAGVIFKPFTNETFWSLKDPAISNSSFHSTDLQRAVKESQQHNKNLQANDIIRIIVSRSHAGDVKDILQNIYGDRASIISAGGSGYKTIELVQGNVDAYMHLTHIKKWDICAPQAIINSIEGAKLTNLYGNPITYDKPKDKLVKNGLVATMKLKTHQELISLTRDLNKSTEISM